MNIDLSLKGADYKLEIKITDHGYYKPPVLNKWPGSPEEYEPAEFEIEKVVSEFDELTFGEWNKFCEKEVKFYTQVNLKANELRANDYSDDEYEKIVELIKERKNEEA